MSENEHRDGACGVPKWRRPLKSKTWNQLLEFSAVGIEMGAAVGIGVFAGIYLDRYFGTEPWLLLLLTFCGIAAAFRNLYIMYKKAKDL